MTAQAAAATTEVGSDRIARLFSFPNPVNEKAARTVAAGVLVLTILTLVLTSIFGSGWLWLSAVLAYGFVARALAGPRFSPLGLLATRIIAPRLGAAKPVPGPPKRFAQAVGAIFTVSAVVLVALGLYLAAAILLGLIVVFSGLESIGGICVGCLVFNAMIRAGLVPASVCEECANVSLRGRS
jgi:Zn-dependent protease